MRTRALSIIELIVAVVILGVVAALAIPRLSQGAVNDTKADLRARAAILRTAIELYYDDHGTYPGQKATGAAPAGSPEAFAAQLGRFTDADGVVSDTPGARFCYGPYLRDGTPICPVSTPTPSGQVALIAGDALPGFDESATGAGWIYNYQTGYIAANSPGIDTRGARYDSY